MQIFLHKSVESRADIEAVVLASGAVLLKRLPPEEDCHLPTSDAKSLRPPIVLVEGCENQAKRPADLSGWSGTVFNIDWLRSTCSGFCIQDLHQYAI